MCVCVCVVGDDKEAEVRASVHQMFSPLPTPKISFSVTVVSRESGHG